MIWYEVLMHTTTAKLQIASYFLIAHFFFQTQNSRIIEKSRTFWQVARLPKVHGEWSVHTLSSHTPGGCSKGS